MSAQAPTITAPTITGKKNNQVKVVLKVKDFKAIQAKNQVLCYVYFKCAKQAGETTLHWNNKVSNGNECIFAIVDTIPTVLPDDSGNFVDGKVVVK